MIALTERAAGCFASAMAEKNLADFGVRIQVVGGGCEGFLYDLHFADAADEQDHVFESFGIRLFVDRLSLRILDGLVVDLTQEGAPEGLLFKNPNARSHCSCGSSFAA